MPLQDAARHGVTHRHAGQDGQRERAELQLPVPGERGGGPRRERCGQAERQAAQEFLG